jgi:hypothetical protein
VEFVVEISLERKSSKKILVIKKLKKRASQKKNRKSARGWALVPPATKFSPLVTIPRSFTLPPFGSLKLKRPLRKNMKIKIKNKNSGEIVVAEIASYC